MIEEKPWVAVEDVCESYGLTYPSAKMAIQRGTFPVSTYKVGKKHVIDKEVHRRFFAEKRAEGLQAMGVES